MPEGASLQHSRSGHRLTRSESAIFVGAVESAPFEVSPAMSADARMVYVRFSPGSRTRLHTHENDQLLLIAEGRGHVGTPSHDIEVIAGDAVRIPAGTPHYHGASSGQLMAHFAMLSGTTIVLDDEQPWPPASAQNLTTA